MNSEEIEKGVNELAIEIYDVANKTMSEIYGVKDMPLYWEDISPIISDKLTPLLADKKVMPKAEFQELKCIFRKSCFNCPRKCTEGIVLNNKCNERLEQYLRQYINVEG